MNNKERKKVEDILRQHFEKEQKIKWLEKIINTLNNSKKGLEEFMLKRGDEITTYINPINFSDSARSKFSKNSITEIKAINNMTGRSRENIFYEITELEIERNTYILELAKMKTETNRIEIIIMLFSKEKQDLLRLKYKENESVIYICDKLNISEATYSRKKQRILKNIYSILKLDNSI